MAGLDAAKRLFPRLVAPGCAVHAVLLYGAPGSGKSTVADALAKAWLCLEEGGGACGACRACLAFDRGACADFQRVEPQPPSRIIRLGAIVPRKDDGVGVPLQTFFRTPPVQARRRVVVIESCDRMNADAANALLKTLEEPHEFVRLVLTTDSIAQVLPTILSRCVAVACELPSPAELEAALGPITEAERLVSEGSPGRIAAGRGDPDAVEAIASFSRRLGKREPGDALAASDSLRSYCDALADAKKCGVRQGCADGLEQLGACVRGLYPERADWAAAIAEAHRRILGNASPGFVFDALMVTLLVPREG